MIPEELKDSCEKAKLVFVILKKEYSATVKQICESLCLKQLEVLPVLRSMENKGVVSRLEHSPNRFVLV